MVMVSSIEYSYFDDKKRVSVGQPYPRGFTPCHSTCYPRWSYRKIESTQECIRLVLAREQKRSLIDQHRTHATDTGSPEVQIALLSERIGQLTDRKSTRLNSSHVSISYA